MDSVQLSLSNIFILAKATLAPGYFLLTEESECKSVIEMAATASQSANLKRSFALGK